MNKLIPRGFSMFNFKKLFVGVLFSIVLSFVLLAAAAGCIVKLGLVSDAAAGTVGLIVGVAALCVAGMVTARWAGERGLIYGVFVSALYSVVFLVFLFIPGCNIDWRTVLIRIAAYFVSGALGGVLGVNRTQHIRF